MDITLRLPFEGDFPVTFSFGALPDDPAILDKFNDWGIAGHHGIDFGLPLNTPVLAADAGIVTQAGENGDWGISVTISHSWGESLYAHLSAADVAVGQTVEAGATIGTSGATGAAFGPHLHFGIRPEDYNPNNSYLGFIDPTPFFSQDKDHGQPNSHFHKTLEEFRHKANEIRNKRQHERQEKIVELARGFPVTNAMVQSQFGVSRQTASKDLAALVKTGSLSRLGRGRKSAYTHTEQN